MRQPPAVPARRPAACGEHDGATGIKGGPGAEAPGAEVVITKNGRPCARLVPLEATRPARRLGAWNVPVRIAPDFDDALDPQDFLDGR